MPTTLFGRSKILIFLVSSIFFSCSKTRRALVANNFFSRSSALAAVFMYWAAMLSRCRSASRFLFLSVSTCEPRVGDLPRGAPCFAVLTAGKSFTAASISSAASRLFALLCCLMSVCDLLVIRRMPSDGSSQSRYAVKVWGWRFFGSGDTLLRKSSRVSFLSVSWRINS